MKLSPEQENVLLLMRQGWELGQSIGGCWMQKGKLGHGGSSRKVSYATVRALAKQGLITKQWGFPASQWVLMP